MKKCVICLLLLFIPVYAGAAEIDEATMKAARQYVEYIDIKEQMRAMMEGMNQMIPEDGMKEFQEKYQSHIDFGMIENACILAAARNFTLEEIQAMNEFFSTPIGQSILSKQGAFNTEVGLVIQQEGMKALSAVMQDMKKQKKDSAM